MTEHEHHRKTDRVERWIDLDVPAERVWALIGDFLAFGDWYPGTEKVEKAEIDGELHRHITLPNGAMFLEKLEEQGDDYYRYSIAEGPLPVENYLATLTCFDREEGGCRVYWSASFDSDSRKADEIVASIFETGLETLRDRFA